MKKLSLSNGELVQLSTELLGNENTKGLLSLKMNMLVKYKLNRLAKTITEELKPYHTINEELIKTYGEEKDGGFFIPYMIDEEKDGQSVSVSNPNVQKYIDEINPILEQVREIEMIDVFIDELKDVDTDGYYPIFFDKIVK